MYSLKKIPIGLYEKALPDEISIKDKLIAAKDAGYDFFEISIDESDLRLQRLDWTKVQRKELLNDVKNIEIPILSMCLSGHRRFPMGSKDVDIRKKAMDIMEKAIYFSSDIGLRTIQLAGYDVYYETADEVTLNYFIEGLHIATNWAQKAGVMLSIEVMDTEFINSVKKAMKYVHEINSPWLSVYPDMGNMSAWGNDLNEDFEAGRGHISQVHIKETKPGIHRDLTFGEGTVDFVKGFSKLYQMGFNGPFLIEMWAKKGNDSISDIKNSLIWVKEKMRKGGFEIC